MQTQERTNNVSAEHPGAPTQPMLPRQYEPLPHESARPGGVQVPASGNETVASREVTARYPEASSPVRYSPANGAPVQYPGQFLPPADQGGHTREWARSASRGRGIVLPLLLIGLGVLFLLNTMNIVDWAVWNSIWRLWPIILIAVGLEILIGRRSAAGSLIIAVALLLALAAGIWLWAVQPFGAWEVSTSSISQPLQGASRANITIDSGLGTLRIGPLTDSQQLISGSAGTAGNETITQDFQVTGDTAYFSLGSKNGWIVPFTRAGGDRMWDLSLNSSVPTNLHVNTGLGDAHLNLEKLNLTGLSLSMGTGSTSVTLPARGMFGATIQGGVGDLQVNVPSGMAARLDISSGLGNKEVPATYRQIGNAYESPGYSTAKDRVDVQIKGGIGNVVVREVQP